MIAIESMVPCLALHCILLRIDVLSNVAWGGSVPIGAVHFLQLFLLVKHYRLTPSSKLLATAQVCRELFDQLQAIVRRSKKLESRVMKVCGPWGVLDRLRGECGRHPEEVFLCSCPTRITGTMWYRWA